MIKIGLRMLKMLHIGEEGGWGKDYVYKYSPEELRIINKLDVFLSRVCAELEIPDACLLEQFTREDIDYGRIPFSFILCGERVGRRADLNNSREVAYVQRLFKENGYFVTLDKTNNRMCFVLQMPTRLFLSEGTINVNPSMGTSLPSIERDLPSAEVVEQQLAFNQAFNGVFRSRFLVKPDSSAPLKNAYAEFPDGNQGAN